MKAFALSLPLFAIAAMFLALAYLIGRTDGHREAREERECYCGETRSCAFAPGIVGVQGCKVSLRWDRCEPDPRYRTEARP